MRAEESRALLTLSTGRLGRASRRPERMEMGPPCSEARPLAATMRLAIPAMRSLPSTPSRRHCTFSSNFADEESSACAQYLRNLPSDIQAVRILDSKYCDGRFHISLGFLKVRDDCMRTSICDRDCNTTPSLKTLSAALSFFRMTGRHEGWSHVQMQSGSSLMFK